MTLKLTAVKVKIQYVRKNGKQAHHSIPQWQHHQDNGNYGPVCWEWPKLGVQQQCNKRCSWHDFLLQRIYYPVRENLRKGSQPWMPSSRNSQNVWLILAPPWSSLSWPLSSPTAFVMCCCFNALLVSTHDYSWFSNVSWFYVKFRCHWHDFVCS